MDCKNLIHPFQHDPGVSQQQRIIDDLLSGSTKIDGRTMADLLNFFEELSWQINYYHPDLTISNWSPFFKKSTPFALAAIIKYDRQLIKEKLALYNKLFDKHPSASGLQLIIHYIFYSVIDKINAWHLKVKATGLPVEQDLEQLIKDKLQIPVTQFIATTNAAVKWYCIKAVDGRRLYENGVWRLEINDLFAIDEGFRSKGNTKRERMIALRDGIMQLLPSFMEVIRVLSQSAERSIEQSLFPLKEELQKKHPPQLAILFAFLKIFQYLQNDLNSFAKKHLDFFYKQVLQLKPRAATPDQVHILFEIQKQLDSYKLEKGLEVKDGKDNNKAEVFFALEDEIVVNKAQVADQRSLFLNNQTFYEKTYLEGVYMAPDAGKADGVEKAFKEGESNSFPTLGAKYSKYKDPEYQYLKSYPNARLGFILASPVLLLNEGERNITINLSCELKEDICKETEIIVTPASGCCEDDDEGGSESKSVEYPEFFSDLEWLYDEVSKVLNETYYYVSLELISQARQKGVGVKLIENLKSFLIVTKEICYCESEELQNEAIVTKADFEAAFKEEERKILAAFFSPRKAINVLFSGEEEWLAPKIPATISLIPNVLPGDRFFRLEIKTTIEADQPAITFYNSESLLEELDTQLPLVKIELDDKIKLLRELSRPGEEDCCLIKAPEQDQVPVSLYHFFRNIIVSEAGGDQTTIDVEVCGLKNLIVQNDESLQDVNNPIYPFGTRPDVPDFTVDTISTVYCITQELIDDAVAAGISVATQNYLESVLGVKKSHRLKASLDDFLDTIPVAGDKATLQAVFNDPNKKYCKLNLVGPNFYIGSKEVFCKKWNDVYININWKEKPVDFNEHYKAYWVDPTDFSSYGINEEDFQINIAVLDNGKWRKENAHALQNPPPAATVLNEDTGDNNRPLFKDDNLAPFCTPFNPIEQTIQISNTYFNNYEQEYQVSQSELESYAVDSLFGFLRINLQNQDFLHSNYAYVLGRQMMALGKFPKEFLEGATYLDAGGTVFVFESTAAKLVELDQLINDTRDRADDARSSANELNTRVTTARDAGSDGAEDITDDEFTTNPNVNAPLQDTLTHTQDTFDLADDTRDKYIEIKNNLSIFDLITGTVVEKLSVLIPNEPWTPVIKEISLDYTATATINDIDLIHLYPYEGTYKKEELEQEPSLLPTFCDEGTLFLGLKDLVPGSNVNILFQLAEATADSESEREEVHWFYLENNEWKLLRPGFEVLDDATNGLTNSGIIKFALPANMSSENTILPTGLHWIKAAIPENSRSVSETIGIHTQAIRATFTNQEENDSLRLVQDLTAGSIAKLKEADASVKKVEQPYTSFGGRVPEAEGHYYVRVSELLRHKDRAIQKFDYERITLEAFPQLFKAKCINHSFALNAHQYINDFPVAPGYVLLAVIPDLNKLKAAQSFEPRVPLSLLEEIAAYLRKRTSPFVRLKVMNPRYEKVHFCLKVRFYKGRDLTYYQQKLKQDLREFMAPWAVGVYDKFSFGQCIYRSDIIRFLESREYLDFILELKYQHEAEDLADLDDKENVGVVCPKTPRSILIAGEIDVCVPEEDCVDESERERDACDHKRYLIF